MWVVATQLFSNVIFRFTLCNGDLERSVVSLPCRYTHWQRCGERLLRHMPYNQRKCIANSWCLMLVWKLKVGVNATRGSHRFQLNEILPMIPQGWRRSNWLNVVLYATVLIVWAFGNRWCRLAKAWPACQPHWTKQRVAMRGSSVHNLGKQTNGKRSKLWNDVMIVCTWFNQAFSVKDWMSNFWNFGRGSLHVSSIHVKYQLPFCFDFFRAPPSATLINVRGLGAKPEAWQLTSLPTPLDKAACCNEWVISAQFNTILFDAFALKRKWPKTQKCSQYIEDLCLLLLRRGPPCNAYILICPKCIQMQHAWKIILTSFTLFFCFTQLEMSKDVVQFGLIKSRSSKPVMIKPIGL